MEHTRVPHGLNLEAVRGGWRVIVVTAAGCSLPPHRRGRSERAKKCAEGREASIAGVHQRCADAGRQRVVCEQLPGCRASHAARCCRLATSSSEHASVQRCVSAIEQFGGCRSFSGSRAHIVRAVQSAQPLGGFFGVAASTYDSHRAALGALWAARPVPRARERHLAMCCVARSC